MLTVLPLTSKHKDDNYYFEGEKWNKLYNYLNK